MDQRDCHRHCGSLWNHLKTSCSEAMVTISIWVVVASLKMCTGRNEASGQIKFALLGFHSTSTLTFTQPLRFRPTRSSLGKLLWAWGSIQGGCSTRFPESLLQHYLINFQTLAFSKSSWFNHKLLKGSDHTGLAHLGTPELVKLNKCLLSEWMSVAWIYLSYWCSYRSDDILIWRRSDKNGVG